MRRYIFILLTLLLVSSRLVGSPIVQARLNNRQPAMLHITSSPNDVRIHLTVPPATLTTHAGITTVTIPGWDQRTDPGLPALPQLTRLIAVPAGTRPVLHIDTPALTEQYQLVALNTVPARQPRQPASSPSFEPDLHWQSTAAPADSPLASSPIWPSALAELSAVVQFRDQQLVALRINAGFWNTRTKQLQLLTELSVQVRFVAAENPAHTPRADPHGMAVLRSQVINPELLPPGSTPSQRVHPTETIQGLRLTVAQSGLYRLLLSDLPASWLGTLEHVRLFQGAVELPRTVAQDALLFFVPPFDQTWSSTTGVIVRYTPDQTAAVPQVRAVDPPSQPTVQFYTATAKVEQQNFYISNAPASPNADHWWGWSWLRIGATNAAPVTVTLTLSDSAAQRELPALLRLRLHGGARGTLHKVSVQINGTDVGVVQWNQRTLIEPEFSIPAGVLSTTNVVVIQAQALASDTPTSLENGYIDWIELDYQRSLEASNSRIVFNGSGGSYAVSGIASSTIDVWDITDGYQPQVLTGWSTSNDLTWSDVANRRYLVQAQSARLHPTVNTFTEPDLQATTQQADYLALTYNPAGTASWSTALQPLLAQRTAQGLAAQLIDVQWIYDQFGTGQAEPQAIRDFLAYAYARWQAPAPAYVLLVGDGTYDPHGYSGSGSAFNYLPPYLAYVDPWIGETAADNRYVTVAGDDPLPDLFIGRLPAHSAADVTLMVDKVLQFEAADPAAAWMQRVLLVADEPDPTGAGDFHAYSDQVRASIPLPYTTTTAYYSGTNVAAFRTQLVEQINNGYLFVNYIGHAGIDIWGNAAFYRSSEIAQLSNAPHYPIMLPMTCYTGFYHDPFTTSLAEQELLQPNGGAVASWSPSGLGIATGHDVLNRTLYSTVFNQGFRRLGPATSAAKLALFSANSGALDLIDTYTIFGDPALTIPLPSAAIQAQPDTFDLWRTATPSTLDVLANDLDPYGTSLQVSSIVQPDHGQVTLDQHAEHIIYTPEPGYIGSVTFDYTAVNPTNGNQSTTTVSLAISRGPHSYYLPMLRLDH